MKGINIMFKFDIGQIIYYLKNNKVHSAPVLSRMIVENKYNNYRGTDSQKCLFNRFGQNVIIYATTHGEYTEDQVFISIEDLKESL